MNTVTKYAYLISIFFWDAGSFRRKMLNSLWDCMTETPVTAIFSVILFSLLSVVVFYIYFLWSGFHKLDHKLFRTVSFTLFSIFAYILVEHRIEIGKIGNSWMGLISAIALFTGPIFQAIFSEYNLYQYKKIGVINHLRKMWHRDPLFDKIRAIVIGPLDEEIIFRAFACTLWEDAHISKKKIIFYVPFIFGVSHFHHFFISTGTVKVRLVRSIVQMIYTTVFGWYVTFLWCKYHSFIMVSLVHGFCNFMEFPDFGGALSWEYPTQKIFIGIAYLFGVTLFIGCMGYMITN